jgi:hypothetical protein
MMDMESVSEPAYAAGGPRRFYCRFQHFLVTGKMVFGDWSHQCGSQRHLSLSSEHDLRLPFKINKFGG